MEALRNTSQLTRSVRRSLADCRARSLIPPMYSKSGCRLVVSEYWVNCDFVFFLSFVIINLQWDSRYSTVHAKVPESMDIFFIPLLQIKAVGKIF